MNDLADQIGRGLEQLGLSMPPDAVSRAAEYLLLLSRWNKVTNLTAVTDTTEMVGTHLMDSFSVAPLITGKQVIDVGSGAGLPGIPLALLYPDKDFILLDSSGKKTRFMTQAKIELNLENVSVVQARAEDFTGQFDHVVVRAVADLTRIVELAQHLLNATGTIVAMKGPETEVLGTEVMQVKEIVELDVPFLDAKRQVVLMSR